MDGFLLSVDLLASELDDHIAFVKRTGERGAAVARFEVYDADSSVLSRDCAYLCIDDEVPDCRRIQQGAVIIGCNARRLCANMECTRCNLIALKDVKPKALVNRMANIFDRYLGATRDLQLYAADDDALELFVDTAQKLLRTPVALLDVNLDVVTASSCQDLFANPLWETIVNDRKPQRCQLLDHCTAQPFPLADPSDHPETPRVIDLAGYRTLSCDVVRHGFPAATLYAFQTRPDRAFKPHEAQLLCWMARCLSSWAHRTERLAASRGLLSERYLIDLLEGAFENDSSFACDCARQVGVEAAEGPEFQLLSVRPTNDGLRPEKMLKTLERLEETLPCCAGALYDETIVVLTPVERDEYLSEKSRQHLHRICRDNGCIGVLSTAFAQLADAPYVFAQINSCFRLIEAGPAARGLHHYYDHMVQQSMRLVIENQPPETMIHPMIRTLIAYDKRCHTDYLDTFKIYLNNRCNVTDTAKQLHMHRNTLLHRIKRIEELLGSTFENWQLRRMLMLSFDYLYLEDDRAI